MGWGRRGDGVGFGVGVGLVEIEGGEGDGFVKMNDSSGISSS